MASIEKTIHHLAEVIEQKRTSDPHTSYIAKRFAKGREKMAQKIGEEGVELALAVAMQRRESVISESADLIFHMMLALAEADIRFEDICDELMRRDGMSGITEKQQRTP